MTYGLKLKTIQAIQDVFANYPQIDKALLYGSRAKGNYRPGSDIDLVLVGPDLDLSLQFKIENELDDLLLPYKIDLSIYHTIENKEFLAHIERVGKVFYEKEAMSEWKEYSLDEVYDFSSGLSKSRDQFGFGHPFLSFKEVFHNFFLPKKLEQLANTNEKERKKCSIKRGDVFLTRTSEKQEELGLSSVALRDYPNATFNGFTKRLRPTGNVEIIPEYAGFYFRSPLFRATVTSMSSMTTRASLNNDMLKFLKINAPSPSEQKAIAEVLLSLDNKIDLLHRQNKTLEQMAEALFRQWFVEEAREDWEEGVLGDLVKNIRESISVHNIDPDCKYVALEHIERRNISLIAHGHGNEVTSNKYKFNNGDILFGKLRPYFHKVCIASFSGICSTDILVLRPRKDNIVNFSLFAFFQDSVVEYANLGSSGTRMPRTDWKSLSEYPISLPTPDLLERFNSLVDPSMKKIFQNITQIRTLENLRDTLLPKLMSGEVSITNDG